MAEYWPTTPWEEHKLTAEQCETYHDVVKSWSHFTVYFLGNDPFDASSEPDYGWLDILREFSKMPTLDIIPEYEREALRELFQKIDNEEDLSAEEILYLVMRAFIKLGMGLFLAREEKLPCEVDREKLVKAEDWRRNTLGVMSKNEPIVRDWPLSQYLLYIRGNKEPLETEVTDGDHSVTEGQWESDM